MSTINPPSANNKKQQDNMSLVDRNLVSLLIVDDEEDFREAASSYFDNRGYPVVMAEDGIHAMDAIENTSFDVAVVDIHMPEMNGLQLLSKIRESDNEIQVIMLTGGGTIENAVESMKNGAYDFVTKPAKLNELDLLIQRAYKNKELVKENRQLRHVLDKVRAPGSMSGKTNDPN